MVHTNCLLILKELTLLSNWKFYFYCFEEMEEIGKELLEKQKKQSDDGVREEQKKEKDK